MSTEDRLGELEGHARDALAQDMALELMVRAIIATHPDPTALHAVFSLLATERLVAMRDAGFDKGHSPEIAQGATDNLKKHLDAWQQVLQKAAGKK